MKLKYIELNYKLSLLDNIKVYSLSKYKNKYFYDELVTMKYNGEFVSDLIYNFFKKLDLYKETIIVNYNFDSMVFLNINLPKMANEKILTNLDNEINNLMPDYKILYNYRFDKVSTFKDVIYRVLLHNKIDEKHYISKELLKDIKPKSLKIIKNNEISESIIKRYKYRCSINYSIIYFKEEYIEINIIKDGKVIEMFTVDIDYKLLNEYNESFNYNNILNINNQYFYSVVTLVNELLENRNVNSSLICFDNKYQEYLKNIILDKLDIKYQVLENNKSMMIALEDIAND